MRFSYSKLKMYEQCPKKYECKYVHGMKEDQSVWATRGINKHGQVEKNLGKEVVPEWMEPHMEYIGEYADAEKELRIYLNKEWKLNSTFSSAPSPYWIMSVVDCLKQDGEEATVIDWKTGKRYDDHQDQLELYSTVVMFARPEIVKVNAAAYYLDESPGGWGYEMELDRDDAEEIKAEYDERINTALVEQEYAPRPGYYCRWCSYAKDKGGPCQFKTSGKED